MIPDGLTLCPLEASDAGQLRAFLAKVFGESDSVFMEPAMLHWKYFQPRADWTDPRSWVFRNAEGEIVTHIGLLPFHLALPGGAVPTCHGLDWGSSIPKAGRELFAAAGEFYRFRLSIGGNEATRATMPKIGYREVGRIDMSVVIMRPWKQFLTSRPRLRPSRLPRLLRNSAAARSRPRRKVTGWSAERVTSFDSLGSVAAHLDPTVTRPARSPAALNYLLSCPADCSAYALSHDGEQVGYVLFSHRWGQTRIIELRITSDRPDDWADAYAVAIELAADDPRTCELIAAGSSDRLRKALAANGFTLNYTRPVWLDDPDGVTAGAPPFEFQAADSDHIYIGDPHRPYLT